MTDAQENRRGLWCGVGEPPCHFSRWNWMNPGVSPLYSPLASPPAPPGMLPRPGSALCSFPKPRLGCLPPFADFIQKQIKESEEGGGWVGWLPRVPAPVGGGTAGLRVSVFSGAHLGPVWGREAQLGPVWPWGPTSGSLARVPGLRGPCLPLPGQAGGLSAWGSQASCCHQPGVSPALSPSPCPSRSRFLPSAVSISPGCRPCL